MSVIDKNEFEAAKKEAAVAIGKYTHTFSPAFVHEGKTYTEIVFDFEKLTGADFLAIEAEMTAMGKPLIAPEFSGDFMLLMSSRASGVASDVLQAMPLTDFKRLHSKARSFLLKQGL